MKLSEAKKVIDIIKVYQNKIDMVAPILDMVNEAPETKAQPKKETPSQIKKGYNFKPKKCDTCGEEFIPHYGAQKTCEACNELKNTAAELAEMEV